MIEETFNTPRTAVSVYLPLPLPIRDKMPSSVDVHNYPSNPAAADEFNFEPAILNPLPPKSPFQDLATELVVQIFRLCGLDAFVTDASLTPVPQPLLTLSRVCQRWNQIVLSSPELWSNLTLVLPRNPKYDSTFFGDEDALLNRSHPSLLSLHLKVTGPSVASLRAARLEAVEALVATASRWRSLDLTFGYRSETSPEARALLSSSPELLNLEVAHITSERYCYDSDTLPDNILGWCVGLVASAPHITDLTWNFPTAPLFNLPFLHLRRLTLGSVTHLADLEVFFKLLPSVPTLESCHVKLGAAINYLSATSCAEYPAVTHHSLSELQISCNTTVLVAPAVMLSSWLESITLPRLKHLGIPRSNLYPPFSAMLTRSGCKLASLALDMASFNGDGQDITALLMHPSIQRTLETLDLRTQSAVSSPIPTPSAVLKYVECSDDHWALPKLASMYFVVEDVDDHLHSLVTSRQTCPWVDSPRHLYVMGRKLEDLERTFSVIDAGETVFEPFPACAHLRQPEEDYSWYDPFSQDDDDDDYYY